MFLWFKPLPSKVALLFPGQGSQYVKMMGNVKDMPAVKEIWDYQLQLPIIQVRNAFVIICEKSIKIMSMWHFSFRIRDIGCFIPYVPPASFLSFCERQVQAVE